MKRKYWLLSVLLLVMIIILSSISGLALIKVINFGLDATLYNNDKRVNDIDVGVNDTQFSYVGEAKEVYTYNTTDWSLINTITLPSKLYAIDYLHGRFPYFTVATEKDGVYVYNYTDFSQVTNFDPGGGRNYDLHNCLNDKYLAVANEDNNVYVYNISDWSLVTTLSAANDDVYSVDFSRDCSHIVYGSKDNNVYVHNVSDWQLQYTLTEATEDVRAVEHSHDQNYLFTGSNDDNVYVYDLPGYNYNQTLTYANGRVRDIDDTTNSGFFSYVSEDSNMYLINNSDFSLYTTSSEDNDQALSTKFFKESAEVAYGTENGNVYVYDFQCIAEYMLYHPTSGSTNLTIPVTLNGTITTNWDEPWNASYINNETNESIYTVYNQTGTIDMIYNWSNLSNDTTYYWYVEGYSQQCGVAHSNVFNFTTSKSCEWEPRYGECLSNDSQLKYYEEVNGCAYNESPPEDNGTYVYCNYCSADLKKNYTTDCYYNGTQYVQDYEYYDANYSTCCAVTNLTTDCQVDYSPYNETNSTNCTYLSEDFQLLMDDEVLYSNTPFKKDIVTAKVWLGNASKDYECNSYVKRFNGTIGDIVQSNPQYEQQSGSLIRFSPQWEENREYFEIKNGIGNIYFTKENVIVDGREYIFGVQCSDGDNVYKTEEIKKVTYHNVNRPYTRTLWLNQNTPALFVGAFIGILLIIAGVFVWRRIRYAR